MDWRDDDHLPALAWRKTITALVRAGRTFWAIDNVTQRLESAQLAALTTAGYWQSRILGRSEDARWPWRGAAVANGNNITVSGELVRRVYRSRVDAELSQPWRGRTFRHKNLPGLSKQRGKLLAALLTMARA